MGAWRCPTLTWGDPTLPSALLRFTSEFGMDSGGTTALRSPSKFFFVTSVEISRYETPNVTILKTDYRDTR